MNFRRFALKLWLEKHLPEGWKVYYNEQYSPSDYIAVYRNIGSSRRQLIFATIGDDLDATGDEILEEVCKTS